MKIKVLSMFTYPHETTGESVTCEQGAVAEVPTAIGIERIELGLAREWRSGDADDISDLLPTAEERSAVHEAKSDIHNRAAEEYRRNAQAAEDENNARKEREASEAAANAGAGSTPAAGASAGDSGEQTGAGDQGEASPFD